MPVTMNGQTYYRTAEVCQMLAIGKTTLFRWLKEGIIKEPELRDRRGWRLFTEYEIDRLKTEVNRTYQSAQSGAARGQAKQAHRDESQG